MPAVRSRCRSRRSLIAALACAGPLSPVLYGLGERVVDGRFVSPTIFWRSSPRGVDLLSFVTPNPQHPIVRWLTEDQQALQPTVFVEYTASLSLVAIAVIAHRDVARAVSAARRLGRGHGRLRAARARPVHLRRRRQHAHARAVGAAALRAGRRPGADADRFCDRRRARHRGAAGRRAGGDRRALAASAPADRRARRRCCWCSSCGRRRARSTRRRSRRSTIASPPIRGRCASVAAVRRARRHVGRPATSGRARSTTRRGTARR